ncbi:ABC transporter, sulfate transport ATP-binding protein [Sphingomonas sp. MM-1]|uniref:sulfate/molybdate ABC transporter ATP-binding protein n=1 Tax=Sphingomonas sp. MM-1 TaxID=745310 RepID=UPI0002C0DD85|nr:sulfate/molybdate ABC transporter ATP-binding protein [Sphingomonas sp. MM-1]AGH48602.1 ABC transporter, sulfate transport ATP-binding protein [Sphingomonas sp. MM-1]
MSIRLDTIGKSFGGFTALGDINLEIEPGEFLALLGPSGSGKTTLLRIVAGLEFPDHGRVFYDGEDITDLKVADRGVGFVFQHYALFRHMTVADNVAFGLTIRKRRDRPAKAEIRDRVQKLLDLVQLGQLGNRYPAQLSGGQRQRVALARALAIEPRLLLLDEPFGALDARVRKDLRRWLRELHDRMGLTSIFVTHDQDEALELADRVVVMDHGVIEQVATPQQIYDEPASAFVFDFVGESNQVPVTVDGDRVIAFDRLLDVPPATLAGMGGVARLFFRPHDAEIVGEGANGLAATVTLVRPNSGSMRVEGKLEGSDRLVEIDVAQGAAPGQGERIFVRPTRAKLYAGTAG